MQYFPFDSRNTLYKSIQTAVASGESLKLRLLLHKDALVFDAFLLIRRDDSGELQTIKMTPAGWLEDYRFYETDLKLQTGLYWYAFKFTSEYGEKSITKTDHSLGIIADDGEWWQLTVYSADFKTPNSFAGGIIYQIFPDRFCASGKEKPNIPNDRFIQTDWYALPEHTQTDNPKRLCNDYFGGDLAGITEKLDYIKSLGVTCIYLNPIFEAHSNHRYNTADYMKIDPSLGSEEDFATLCKEAKKRGISVILDGVFSHTGDDSVYFNKYERYEKIGAANTQDSPYISWFKFQNWPHIYHSWWGVSSLPETVENDPAYTEFITGENGVIRHWLRLGASGWRLDVADELPDEFLEKIRYAVKTENPEAFLFGEVWEDATNKISYGSRRKFLSGNQLDSVMNYPLADLIVGFVCGGNARELIDGVLTIRENYPPQSVNLLMNHIGTHDTARILTRLGDGGRNPGDREAQSKFKLTNLQRAIAERRLILASVLQYTLPGIPSLYYGDEAGCEGYGDPFCRATYPWGRENTKLLEHYKALGNFRTKHPVFADGEFIPLYSDMGYVTYMRENENECILICVNRWCDDAVITLPEFMADATVAFGETPVNGTLNVRAESFGILYKKKDGNN